MKSCPFPDCGREIPDYLWCCNPHFYALPVEDQQAINTALLDLRAGRIGEEAFRLVGERVLGERQKPMFE